MGGGRFGDGEEEGGEGRWGVIWMQFFKELFPLLWSIEAI
jgi:hypothetical protein